MVVPLDKRHNKVNSTFLLSFTAITLLTITMSWFIVTYWLNELIQATLYPYSDYPVVVYAVGEIVMFPGWVLLCLTTLIGINEIALTLLNKHWLVKVKEKILQVMLVMLVVTVVIIIVDYIVWQVAARSNGYSQCPSGTLLLGHKVSSAWAKDEALCYSKEIKYLLPTGTHQQVVEVAEYLNKKH